jgi:hypothetical protein
MQKTTILDRARRGVFPPQFKPGDVFARVVESPERITFVLQKDATVPPAKIFKDGGRTYLVSGRKLTQAAIEKELESFP